MMGHGYHDFGENNDTLHLCGVDMAYWHCDRIIILENIYNI